MFKIPKVPLGTTKPLIFKWGEITNSLLNLQWTAHREAVHQRFQTSALPLANRPTYWSMVGDWGWLLEFNPPWLSSKWQYPTNGASSDSLCVNCLRGLGCLGQPCAPTWVPSSRTLRWYVGIFSLAFPTQTWLYMSLGPLTWILSKTNT